MTVAAGAEREPHRYDQPAALQLNPVARPGRENLPGVVLLERVEGARGDFGWLAPGLAIVIAATVEAAHVFEAEEQVNGAGFVRDHHRVVVSDVVLVRELLLQRDGVALLRSRHVGDLLRLVPGFAAI